MSFSDRLRDVFQSSQSQKHENRIDSDREVTSVAKERIESRKKTASAVRNTAQKRNAEMWTVDPRTLEDYASNPLVEIFVDTLAKDVSSSDWDIVPRDSDADVPEERLNDIRRDVEELHAEDSFSDLLEAITRSLLIYGNSALVKEYFSNGELAEVVDPAMTTMYKVVDSDGLVDGYVQAVSRGASVDFEEDAVVWFEWGSQSGRTYAKGPTEQAVEAIEILDELILKETKDLTEGGPSGVLTQVEDNPDNPMSAEEIQELKESWELKEGERHRSAMAKGNWDFVSVDANYEELEILPRQKHWTQVVASAFKVSPSYVGLDFENTNRATDESQRESTKQRGFQTVVSQIEEKLNREIIQPEFDDDVEVKFQKEKTLDDKKQKAEYWRELGEAAEQLQSVGVDVRVSGDQLVVEDGDAEAPGGDAGEQEKSHADRVDDPEPGDDVEPDIDKTPEMERVEQEHGTDIRLLLSELEARVDDDDDDLSRAQAADKLGVTRRSYYNWLESCGLKSRQR